MNQHVIWKYPLRITDLQTLEMPVDARLLTVQNQGGTLCLWAIVNPSNPRAHRTIMIAGTGNPFPKGTVAFIATAQQGQYVWHVFEVLA